MGKISLSFTFVNQKQFQKHIDLKMVSYRVGVNDFIQV